MKKILVFLALAIVLYACVKDSMAPVEAQKGSKTKTATPAQSTIISTQFPQGEDLIVSVDSVKYGQTGSYSGNNVFWSVRGDTSLLPSYCGVIVSVYIEANWVDKWGVSSPTSHWTTVGQDYNLTYAPGKAGSIFDGYPNANETRIYRATLIDKYGIVHNSSAYQVN